MNKTTLLLAIIVGGAIGLSGCASAPVVDELGGRHHVDNTLRCDVEFNGRCAQWSRTRALRSVRQEP